MEIDKIIEARERQLRLEEKIRNLKYKKKHHEESEDDEDTERKKLQKNAQYQDLINEVNNIHIDTKTNEEGLTFVDENDFHKKHQNLIMK